MIQDKWTNTLNSEPLFLITGEFKKISTLKNKLKNALFYKHKVLVLRVKNNEADIDQALNHAKKYKPNQVIKIDGDGQHDPKFIRKFINYQKKYPNRMIKGRREMSFLKTKIPLKRFIGNNIITFIIRFITKNSQLNDVVNGFISLPNNIISKINFKSISSDFFFEQDLLIYVSKKRFVINEILISTKYFDQKSNLSEIKVILPFLKRYLLIIFGFYNF